ncbi:MAG: ribonuclease H [Bacteroidaceae bacterium]|nr:ribonuclease H [Bacteroidaceae bacterium]
MQNPPDYRTDTVLPLPPEVAANAWAVDGACSGNPGPMEYRCVDLQTGYEVFHFGPIPATNNIGEFLAIVHALALMEQSGITGKIIYSDSVSGMAWVRNRKAKTVLERTAQTAKALDLVARAEMWLRTHNFRVPIVKWDTRLWGEIPADFNRKK